MGFRVWGLGSIGSKLLKGGYVGGSSREVFKDTRSLDYSSLGLCREVPRGRYVGTVLKNSQTPASVVVFHNCCLNPKNPKAPTFGEATFLPSIRGFVVRIYRYHNIVPILINGNVGTVIVGFLS